MREGQEWCQPADVLNRTWLVIFEDQDQGSAKFYDEDEARRFFEKADAGGWNCYLFQAAPTKQPERTAS